MLYYKFYQIWLQNHHHHHHSAISHILICAPIVKYFCAKIDRYTVLCDILQINTNIKYNTNSQITLFYSKLRTSPRLFVEGELKYNYIKPRNDQILNWYCLWHSHLRKLMIIWPISIAFMCMHKCTGNVVLFFSLVIDDQKYEKMSYYTLQIPIKV